MNDKKHDKYFDRMTMFLTMLDNDERPSAAELAEEFSVSDRSIQRDVEKLHYFPIEKENGRYKFSEGFSLKRTQYGELEMILIFLSLSTMSGISPKHSKAVHTLMSKLLRPTFASPYLIKQDPFEAIDVDSMMLQDLKHAITNTRVTNIYLKELTFEVEPYKIVSFDEIWYLFAKELHSNKIKTYFISDMKRIDISQKTFKMPKMIDEILENVHTAWFEDGVQFDVQIKVMQPIAHYFKLKKHLISQKIVKENKDGSLIVDFTVSADEDVDNLVKAWLPHIEVISPERLRTKILDELECYVKALRQA